MSLKLLGQTIKDLAGVPTFQHLDKALRQPTVVRQNCPGLQNAEQSITTTQR